mgnify:CR=1 FL=1
MAYEYTYVAPEKSQGQIRKLLEVHGAKNVSFASQNDPVRMEGFRATVVLENKPYGMKIVVPVHEQKNAAKLDQEIRRVWRVLYHHMKAVFEAADSGVMDIRELLLPFLVTSDGQTVGQKLLRDIPKALEAPHRAFLS